jgi:hypothetical protein
MMRIKWKTLLVGIAGIAACYGVGRWVQGNNWGPGPIGTIGRGGIVLTGVIAVLIVIVPLFIDIGTTRTDIIKGTCPNCGTEVEKEVTFYEEGYASCEVRGNKFQCPQCNARLDAMWFVM